MFLDIRINHKLTNPEPHISEFLMGKQQQQQQQLNQNEISWFHSEICIASN